MIKKYAVMEEEKGQLAAQLADVVNEREDIISIINNDRNFEINNDIAAIFDNLLDSVASEVPLNTLNLAFITDNHYEKTPYAFESLNHYKYIAELTRRSKIDAIICGGDNVNGNVNKSGNLKELGDVTSTLFTKSKSDVFFVKGNHDDGSYWSLTKGTNKLSEILTTEELKEVFNTNALMYDEKRKNGSLYFYKDYEQHKIRVIGLDSFDLPNISDSNGNNKYPTIDMCGFQNEQINWLGNDALKLPSSDWQVIIFTHAALKGSIWDFPQTNVDLIWGVLNAFKNGSSFRGTSNIADFNASVNVTFDIPGTVIAIVSGHLHKDSVITYNGFTCIESLNSLCLQGNLSSVTRTKGTTSEDAWDVFSINPTNRTIKITRFGAGISRTVNY